MNATVKKSAKPSTTISGNAKPAGSSTAAKSAAKTATAATTATDPATTATPVQAGKRSAPATKVAPGGASKRQPDNIQSGKPMSSDNAQAGLQDRIDKTAVSKVREVATKTPKAAPITTEGTLLSEAQIMKMGEKDYMNAAQLAFFKARLQQLERDLLKNAGETTEHLRETVLVPDPADRATIEEEHALELRTRDRERKLLKKVQQSIASIDTGDYGWCEETGEPIGIPRLLARPTATLSLEAQQRRELKQKLYGD